VRIAGIAQRRSHHAHGRWRLIPSATQGLEYGDLILNQRRIRGGRCCIRGDQHLLGGQQVEIAQRAIDELIVRQLECRLCTFLGIAQCLAAFEFGAIGCQGLYCLAQRLQNAAVEVRERVAARKLGKRRSDSALEPGQADSGIKISSGYANAGSRRREAPLRLPHIRASLEQRGTVAYRNE
jgi:hypothetical protein